MINLSTLQREIIESEIGKPMQVLASAGAGKTRVLTERIRYILSTTKKEGIIALTFTNKAADEMRSRLDDVSDVESRCWISTIHGIAQRVVEQYGNTIGLPPQLQIYERDQDRKAILLQSLVDSGSDLVKELDSQDEKSRSITINKCMEQLSLVKRELLTDDEISEVYASSDFLQIYRNYQEALLASGGIDFDDILVYAHRVFLEQPWCAEIYQSKYKHLCVDEAQDLNRAQYEFIRALCGDTIKSIIMVGDPNQMIYGFNGSSHDFLCKHYVSDFEPLQFELRENYRSSKAVIRLANSLKPASQIVSDFALDGLSELVELETEEDEANWVCAKIEELLSVGKHTDIEGSISTQKMVVIARNRFVFSTLEKLLNEKRIEYSIKRGETRAEPSSTFGKILDLAIRVKLNPRDWIDGKKLVSVLELGTKVTYQKELDLMALSEMMKTSSVPLADIQSALLGAISKLDDESPQIPKFCGEFEEALKQRGTVAVNDDSAELERSLQELSEFKSCWTQFRRKGLGNSLSSFKNALALGQLTDEVASSALTLSTVHTMKGLERDIVFLIGMCEGVFPDYRAKSAKQIEEERNSAFVAVTRARRWIYVTNPKYRKMPWGDTRYQEPSRFLEAMRNN